MKNYELAEIDYVNGMSYKNIAEKYNTTVNTVRSWKTRKKWKRTNSAQRKTVHQNVQLLKPKIVKKKRPGKKVNITQKLFDAVDENEALDEAHKLFCVMYVTTNNAVQAYLQCFNCTKATARVMPYKLLARDSIKNEVHRLRKLMRNEYDLDPSDLIDYCLKVVGADIGDYVTFGQREVAVMGMFGPLLDEDKQPVTKLINIVEFAESDQVDTSVISEIKQGKDGVSIKLADKKWAWEQLIKCFDLLPDKYQRKVEKKRLELETEKVRIMAEKNAPPLPPDQPLILQPVYGVPVKPVEDGDDDDSNSESNTV